MEFFRKHKNLLIEIGLLAFLSLTPFLWVGHGWIILGHDSGFRLNIASHFRHLWDTWNGSVNTGIDWSIYKGFLIIQLPELILQTLLGSLEKAQVFILSFWFFVMAIGMYVPMRRFFREKEQWFLRLYVSIFWVFNFYILQGWFIAERAKFSLYAALPVSVCLFFTAFRPKHSPFAIGIVFGLLYFFLNGGGSPPLYGASLVVWGITFGVLTVRAIRNEGRRGLLRSFQVACCFIIPFIFLNFYWILPQINLLRGQYTASVASQGGIDGLLSWEKEISKYASLPNLLRLQGLPDWYNNPGHSYSHPFLTNPLLILASFLPITAVVLGFLLVLRRRLGGGYTTFIVLLLVLFVVGLFFSSGSHAPTGFLYIFFMRHIPGFAIFRSSLYKFLPVFFFSIIVLSGFFINQLIHTYVSKLPGRILKVLLLAGVLIYHYPFFSPSFFQFDPQFTTRVSIPAYVQQVGNYIDTKGGRNGRILLLPALDGGYPNASIDMYSWGYYSLDLLPRSVADPPVLANDAPFPIVNRLYDGLRTNNKSEIQRSAAILGVSDVLSRDDAWLPSSEAISHSMVGLEKSAVHFGSWSLYPLAPNSILPSTATNILPLIEPVTDESYLVASTDATVIRTTVAEAQRMGGTYAVEAECFYCKQNEYKAFMESVTLPPVRWLPGAFLYSLLVVPRIPAIEKNMADTTVLDILLSRQMTVLSEYAGLVGKGGTGHAHVQIDTYTNLLSQISDRFSRLAPRDSVIYALRLNAFLATQQRVVQTFPNDERKKTEAMIEAVLSHIKSSLWTSDDHSYRYGISVPEDGEYIVNTYPTAATSVTLDGNPVGSVPVRVAAGFHRLERSKLSSNEAPPSIYFLRQGKTDEPSINPNVRVVSSIPSEYVVDIPNATKSFLFILPISYDTRWQATVLTGNARVEGHVLTNGYANGWIVQGEGNIRLKLEFLPHRMFLIGGVVSSVAFVICVVSLGMILKKKKGLVVKKNRHLL